MERQRWLALHFEALFLTAWFLNGVFRGLQLARDGEAYPDQASRPKPRGRPAQLHQRALFQPEPSARPWRVGRGG